MRYMLLRALSICAAVLGAFLLYRVFQRYDLAAIMAVLLQVEATALLLPIALVIVSYLSLATSEFIAARYATGRGLPFARVAMIALGALGIGHSIGFAALSSGAVRFRMYTRSGVSVAAVARIILFSATTVGLGFMTLIALGLLIDDRMVTSVLGIGRGYRLTFAIVILVLPILYLSACSMRHTPFQIGRFRLKLPRPGIAALQILMGSANLLCKSAVLWASIRLFAEADFVTVASLYVAGDGASLIGHVPGGWGVLEFIVLHQLPDARAAAGLLVFRVIYYLAPLLLGLGVFLGDEILRRRPGRSRAASDDSGKPARLRYVTNFPHR